MPELQKLAAENEPFYGSARVFSLCARKELDLFDLELHMQQARSGAEGNTGSKTEVATRTIEQQVEQIRTLANQHYPDDAEARNAWMVERLIQRLREYHAQFVRLEVRE